MKTKLNWKAAVPTIIFAATMYPIAFYFTFMEPPIWLTQGSFRASVYLSVAIGPVLLLYAIVQKLREK